MKKLLCAVLSGIMVFSTFAVAVPITASAAESQESVSATYGDFEYTLEDDYTCTITKYNGHAANVTIPSTIYGNKVTKIGNSSFRENNNLMSVTIPNSVKEIDSYAFANCYSLSTVTFSNSLKSIGYSAFAKTNLKKVTIPNSVTEIDEFAFSGCENLSSLTLSNKLESIGGWAFESCTSLTSVTLPNSVTEIGVYAFDSCSSLKTVSIGSGLKYCYTQGDGRFIFGDCIALESITVSSSNNNYSSANGIMYDKKKTEILVYPQAKKDTSYTVPSTIKTLYFMSTNNNPYLKTITIPSSVTDIRNNAVGYTTKDGWNYNKVSGFTIKGYKGTEAERYARNNDFNFVQLQVVPTSVALNKTTLTLDIGKTSNLRATVYPSNASNKKCTWSSSNTSVATVDGNGKVTAKASGTATITVKTSNGKTATCKVTVNLPTPQITSLANTTGGIKISWNKVSGAYGYRLYYKPASGGWKRFKDTTATSFTDSGVVPNKTETYTIRCIDKNGNTISGFNSTGWSKKYTPAAPTVSKLDITTGGIKLSWNKIAGVYGYRLYYKTSSGGWKRFKDTTATSFTDSGVSPNRTETYTIRCIDKNGNTVSGFYSKGWSKKYTPVAPTISKLDNTSGGIKLSWNKIAGVYGYRLYYKTSSGGWKRFKDTTATSFTDSGVSPNRTETYTIRCIDRNGNTVSGFNSNGWSIKYTPVAPTISKLENTSGGIKLTWNKIAGVYGYRLYYRPASGGWKRFKDTTATTYTDAAVKSGRTETYTIRCIDKNGNTVSGYNSKGWSKKYVYNPPKSIKLNKTSAYIGKKESVTLKYTLSAGSTSTVTWSSSNKNVATVSGGKVTAKGAGATTITATTANGKKATCKVTVINGVRQYYTCTSGNRTIAEYSVVVPDGCYDKQSNAWRCYYEKYNYDKYDMGYVGAILFTKSPYSQSSPPAPNFTKLGEKNGYVFGYTTATGLEFIADDITSVEKYSTAHQTFNYAVKTFRFE